MTTVDEVMSCAICRSAEGVRRFAITVDGDELRLVALLCSEHGDAYLLNTGRVLGELFARKGKLPVMINLPGLPKCPRDAACIRGAGHPGGCDDGSNPLDEFLSGGRAAQQAVGEAIAAQRQRGGAGVRVFTQSDRCQLCGAWRHDHTGLELECPADQKGSSRS